MSHADDHEGTRRDFIYYATAGAGAVVTGAAVWPLVNQMNPSADVRALASIRVDVADVEPGTQLTVKWLGKPVFIRRRTEAEIAEARQVAMSDLADAESRNENVPGSDASDENRSLDEAGEWLVMMGVCTHLAVYHWVMALVTLMAGSAHATVHTTIHRVAFAKVRHQRTCRYLSLNLSTHQQSN